MDKEGNKRRRLLVLCPFPEGVAAGQRLKYEQYLDDWRHFGFDVIVSPFMDIKTWNRLYVPGSYGSKVAGVLRGHLRRLRDIFRVRDFDIVYVHMNVTPLGTTIFERLVRALARRLVYDVEDNVIGEASGAANYHPNPIVRLLKGKGKAKYLIRMADHVVTSSPQLNDRCLGVNKYRACTYISSSVDTDRFVPSIGREPNSLVTVGWTGTFSSSGYLELLRPVFRALAARVHFKLKVISNFEWYFPEVNLDVVQWSVETEVEEMQSIDIGVYPMAIEEFATGKSGLKAIQYMAFGLPTVATDYGTTPLIIQDRKNGLLVRTEDEWVEALELLICDGELRRRLGDAARRDAVAKYSTRAIAADYRGVLRNLMGRYDD